MAAGLTRSPALVLIGFMGAGKTAAARAIAAELGTEPQDSDALLERELGMPIADFFDREGETEFREREERLVCDLLERADGAVISLGGGALLSGRVRAALEPHVPVLLEVDAETSWRRAASSSRPLARDRRRFDELHAERLALYERYARAFLPAGDRALARRALPALRRLAASGAPDARMLWAASASGEYPVYVGRGILGPELWPLEGRRFCVSDETVQPLYAERLAPLEGMVTVEAGEGSKTVAGAERVWRELAGLGMTRGDHLAALGGGVVGDLAGFCAATYQRGVPVVQVPTTLVAQVDSAYGGKTGVDLPEAKNYVGAYHQPAGVLADPSTLESLPEAEIAAGYAEVVKTALIAGGPLWERVRGGSEVDAETILACARIKLAVVAEDERDAGHRQVLNLGHTIGHAVETVTGYRRYRHGEAVALGLLAALRLSGQEGLRAEVAELLGGRGLPMALDGVSAADVVAATARDKKRAGRDVGFVLLDAPGAARTGCRVGESELLAAVEELTT